MKIHQTQTIHTFPDILVLFLQLTLFFFRLPEPRAKNCWNCWYMYSFCIMPEEGYKNKQKYCWRHFINWNFPLLCTLYKGLKDKSQFLVIWKWKQWKPEKGRISGKMYQKVPRFGTNFNCQYLCLQAIFLRSLKKHK